MYDTEFNSLLSQNIHSYQSYLKRLKYLSLDIRSIRVNWLDYLKHSQEGTFFLGNSGVGAKQSGGAAEGDQQRLGKDRGGRW